MATFQSSKRPSQGPLRIGERFGRWTVIAVGYPYYGGRGIRMAEVYVHDFAAWFREVGPQPSSEHTIDRIDNYKGYEPGNMRWATRKEQMSNLRPRVRPSTRCRLRDLEGRPIYMHMIAHQLAMSTSAYYVGFKQRHPTRKLNGTWAVVAALNAVQRIRIVTEGQAAIGGELLHHLDTITTVLHGIDALDEQVVVAFHGRNSPESADETR